MKKTKKTKNNAQIIKLTEENIELESKWKRALADYQNLSKRTQSERSSFVRLANASLIEKMLGIIDDLERASAHINDDGINMIVKQLNNLLEEEGVEEILAENQVFDPKKMECVEITKGEKDMVASVVQKGYIMEDFVLRPAKVEVGGDMKSN